MTAEDIVQDIFLKLFENIDIIKIKESVNYWLFRTARNEIYGWYRKQKTYRKIFDSTEIEEMEISDDYNLTEEIEIKEVSGFLNMELEQLPPAQKEVFILKEYGGLSYEEIAGVMAIDVNLVRSRLYKVRQRLTERLAKKIK